MPSAWVGEDDITAATEAAWEAYAARHGLEVAQQVAQSVAGDSSQESQVRARPAPPSSPT